MTFCIAQTTQGGCDLVLENLAFYLYVTLQ